MHYSLLYAAGSLGFFSFFAGAQVLVIGRERDKNRKEKENLVVFYTITRLNLSLFCVQFYPLREDKCEDVRVTESKTVNGVVVLGTSAAFPTIADLRP